MEIESKYKNVPGADGCYFPDLESDEELFMVVRRHWFSLILVSLYLVVFIALTVVMFVLQSVFGISDLVTYLSLICIWSIGSQLVFVTWINHELDILLVTNRRIIGFEQIGFLSRQTSQTSIDQIQEVTAATRGVLASIFHFGQITIHTASETTDLVLPLAPETLNTARIIHNFVDKYRHQVAKNRLEKLTQQK